MPRRGVLHLLAAPVGISCRSPTHPSGQVIIAGQVDIDDAMKMSTTGLVAADLGTDQAALAGEWEAGRQLLSFGPTADVA